MNLRFPEIFGLLLFCATLCSFGLPASASGRVTNSLHFVFAPVSGPIQWMLGSREEHRYGSQDVPIRPEITDELARLREEKRQLETYAETLKGQVETLARRQAEAERVGHELRDVVQTVKVVSADANGRDIIRLASTSAPLMSDVAVVAPSGIVGKVMDVALINGSASVRLITDRGFKLIGSFGRFERVDENNVQLRTLAIEPTVVEGMGRGEMRVDGLKMSVVEQAGLRIGDLVLLADSGSQWPIAMHGYHVGAITYVRERPDVPGVAEVRVRPESNLMTLRDVWVVNSMQKAE